MRAERALLLIVAFALVTALACRRGTPPAAWATLDAGLELGTFAAEHRSDRGDSLIRVLRADPRQWETVLCNASAPDEGARKTAREWADAKGLVAAINAAMFQEDELTAVSMMRSASHVNNGHLTRDKSVFAFDRRDHGVPQVQIIDRELQDFDALGRRYRGLVQGIRLVSRDGRNVWAAQPRRHSIAALGIDRQGYVLFMHIRSPYAVHDAVDELQRLPIGLVNAQYADGGPLAQMFVRAAGREWEFVGMPEVGFLEADRRDPAQPIPNVLGLRRRATS